MGGYQPDSLSRGCKRLRTPLVCCNSGLVNKIYRDSISKISSNLFFILTETASALGDRHIRPEAKTLLFSSNFLNRIFKMRSAEAIVLKPTLSIART